MRLLFMGTPDFAVPALDALVEAGHEVAGVVAQPDKPQGRGNQLQSPPVAVRARELGLELRQPRAVRSGAFPEWVEGLRLDVAVVVAYGRILTPRLLSAPRLGCINIHASLLPRYRGAAPIQWAVVRGEAETGVCTMQMEEGLDTGPVLLRRATPIGPEETSPELWQRLSRLGAEMIVETLARLPELRPEPQDHAAHSLAPMLRKEDGLLDWSRPAQELHNQIRGLLPWPGCHSALRGEPLKLLAARPAPEVELCPALRPGELIATTPRLLVATGQGALEILQAQLPGRKAQPGAALAHGARLRPGERLGPPESP
jgi:methionyl-tRNA formyltransferase